MDSYRLVQSNQLTLLRRLTGIISAALLIYGLSNGREILLPIALSLLIAFLLTPATRWLERRHLSRMMSVATVVLTAVGMLALLGWLVAGQVVDLSAQMPRYKGNLLAKIRSARTATQGSLADAARTIQELGQELETNSTADRAAPATLSERISEFLTGESAAAAQHSAALDVRVVELPPSPVAQIRTWLGPLIGPLTTAGVVFVLVVFLLLNREDLRDRLIQLAGSNNLHSGTIAIDEASDRVSHYLRMQLFINSLYGLCVFIGLYLIGIPNSLLWGVMGVAFRFVPFIGPWFIFSVPFLLSLALSANWIPPVFTAALFIVLELILNNAVEPWLYGKSTGISSMGVMVSLIFWASIWGPAGLVLATPITVCLVVFGRYFPQLHFMTTLFGEQETLSLHQRLYHRMLVDDWEATAELIRTQDHSDPLEWIDQTVLPVVKLVELHRHEGLLDDERASAMLTYLQQLVEEVIDSDSPPASSGVSEAIRILVVPDRDQADLLVGELLASRLRHDNYIVEVVSNEVLSGELPAIVTKEPFDLVVLSAVPPGAGQFAQHTAKRLSQQMPRLPVLIGLWDDEAKQRQLPRLKSAGASAVESTLQAMARQVQQLQSTVKLNRQAVRQLN